MHKILTIQAPDEIRTARVMLVLTHGPLQAAVEEAVLAAIDAWRGERGERVVHMREARNRPAGGQDAPPPGALKEKGDYYAADGDEPPAQDDGDELDSVL